MFCIYCGTRLPEKAAFCPACGAKVTWEIYGEKGAAGKDRPHVKTDVPTVCASCGSNRLKRVRKGVYICEHCGNKFYVDEQSRIESEEEIDARILTVFAEADGYIKKKEYKSALQALAKGLEIDPDNGTLMIKLGMVCRNLGYAQEALEYYQKAETLVPDDPTIYVNEGTLYMDRGRPDKARPLYEKGLAMMEEDPMCATITDVATTYACYAMCIGKLGDTAGAKKYLTMAKERGYDRESIKSICHSLYLDPNRI